MPNVSNAITSMCWRRSRRTSPFDDKNLAETSDLVTTGLYVQLRPKLERTRREHGSDPDDAFAVFLAIVEIVSRGLRYSRLPLAPGKGWPGGAPLSSEM